MPAFGSIQAAATPSDFAAFAGLVTEYVDRCRVRCHIYPWFVERVFGHQSLADEPAALQLGCSAPRGTALLFVVEGAVRGGGAIRRLTDGSCEMKRLFVPDRHRGQGIGRRLCKALIAAARSEGFPLMRLDTAALFTEAITKYEAFGPRLSSPCRGGAAGHRS